MKILTGLSGAMAAFLAVAGSAHATTLSGAVTADNAFFAYLGDSPNSLGTLVGSGNAWNELVFLDLDRAHSGRDQLPEYRSDQYGGPGGLSFVLNLSDTGFAFGNGGQTLTTDPANLGAITGTYNNNNSSVAAQTWVAATGAVIQDIGYPWGNVVGTSNWADASTLGLNTCSNGDCTVDFTVAITPTSVVPEASTWAMMLLGFATLGFAGRRARKTIAIAA